MNKLNAKVLNLTEIDKSHRITLYRDETEKGISTGSLKVTLLKLISVFIS